MEELDAVFAQLGIVNPMQKDGAEEVSKKKKKEKKQPAQVGEQQQEAGPPSQKTAEPADEDESEDDGVVLDPAMVRASDKTLHSIECQTALPVIFFAAIAIW